MKNPISLTEAKNLKYGQHIEWYSPVKRKYVRLKINGKPKTWKTRPNQVKVPVKYGLYEYFYLDENDLDDIRGPMWNPKRKRRNPSETGQMAKSLLPTIIIGTFVIAFIAWVGRQQSEE